MKTILAGLFFSALVCFALCGAAFAAQPVLDKPAAPDLYLSKDDFGETVITVSFPVPQRIRNFQKQAETQPGAPNLLIEFDTRMDGGKWFLDRESGGPRKAPLQEELLNRFKYRFLVYRPGAELVSMTKYESAFEAFMFEHESWDLDNHSASFRYRYVYEQMLPSGDEPAWEDRASPWSDEVSVGKKR